jgi:hypothetical protein
MTSLHILPAGTVSWVPTPTELDAIQAYVDGGYLEGVTVTYLGHRLMVYVDEEGRNKRLSPNVVASTLVRWLRRDANFPTLCGPALLSQCDGDGNDVGLADEVRVGLCNHLTLIAGVTGTDTNP